MKHAIILSLLTLATPLLAQDAAVPKPAPEPADKPLVQLALLLDTSGSMGGMINQAKAQLWAIVNEFLSAKRDGQKPRLEVALYRYGSPSLGQENGYIKQLTPLTEDLDKVSEELFKLTTDGGDEYCGWVIRTAMDQLKWSTSNRDYKAVFIAGNEAFGQGPVDFRKVCKQAIEKGIIVNTIHCSGGEDSNWKDGAVLADGRFLRISTDQVDVEIETPLDDQIAKLSEELNGTYIAYGAGGAESARRQSAMDSSSRKLGVANATTRARTKASAYYSNAGWDLVDAKEQKAVDLATIKKEDLPAPMREMDAEQRKAYVEGKAKERTEIQKQIAELSVKRDAFVNEKQAELAGNDKTLGNQVQDTIKVQAVDLGFEF
jgi:hypothetical protein